MTLEERFDRLRKTAANRALNRDGFALGALDAAKFLAGKPPRLYTMADLLG